mmetsp:Transcript_8416/g.27954  ORF Transcript_8416/g.27954 Transcript_8416/m.27954 type:complete len:228 (-) Transcript_8416:224-907(-)
MEVPRLRLADEAVRQHRLLHKEALLLWRGVLGAQRRELARQRRLLERRAHELLLRLCVAAAAAVAFPCGSARLPRRHHRRRSLVRRRRSRLSGREQQRVERRALSRDGIARHKRERRRQHRLRLRLLPLLPDFHADDKRRSSDPIDRAREREIAREVHAPVELHRLDRSRHQEQRRRRCVGVVGVREGEVACETVQIFQKPTKANCLPRRSVLLPQRLIVCERVCNG